MQLPLGPDPRTATLRKINTLLINYIGRVVRPPEKRRVPEWVLVQGVIGARTKTIHSNRSADDMLAHYGSWEKVAEAPDAELLEFLKSATFPELMVERLKACLQAIIAQRGSVDLSHLEKMSTQEAMDWLETLPGVARKISAGVVNTSTLNRKAIVLDTNHLRVVQRLGLVPAKADTERAYNILMPIMPEEWSAQDIDEHHLLVKRIGQRLCRPKQTYCKDCPLKSDCQYAQAAKN